MNDAVAKLKRAASYERLFYRIKIISRNSTHYRLENEVAEYFGCSQVVKHSEVDLSVFGKKILFLTSTTDELIKLENIMS